MRSQLVARGRREVFRRGLDSDSPNGQVKANAQIAANWLTNRIGSSVGNRRVNRCPARILGFCRRRISMAKILRWAFLTRRSTRYPGKENNTRPAERSFAGDPHGWLPGRITSRNTRGEISVVFETRASPGPAGSASASSRWDEACPREHSMYPQRAGSAASAFKAALSGSW
jgi:hypothetical protein